MSLEKSSTGSREKIELLQENALADDHEPAFSVEEIQQTVIPGGEYDSQQVAKSTSSLAVNPDINQRTALPNSLATEVETTPTYTTPWGDDVDKTMIQPVGLKQLEDTLADAQSPANGIPGADALHRKQRYVIENTLGQGAMGEVFSAQDTYLARRVAIKRPRTHQYAELNQQRILDEARLLSQMEHPNLPTVYSLELDGDGHAFYSMRFEGDQTLSQVMELLTKKPRDQSLYRSLTVKLDLFQGLLSALIHAHQKGILHRDVKPDNIMVGPNGEVKLIDWGVATKSTPADDPSAGTMPAFAGTPRYTSPEQAFPPRSPADERSDIYSAFVVLYELLTLRPWIEPGLSIQETFTELRRRQPPSVDDRCFHPPFAAAVPKELRYYIQKGLANAPDARFQTAMDALHDLRQLRNGDLCTFCVVTGIKKQLHLLDRLLDRYPRVSSLALLIMPLLLLINLILMLIKLTTIASP